MGSQGREKKEQKIYNYQKMNGKGIPGERKGGEIVWIKSRKLL